MIWVLDQVVDGVINVLGLLMVFMVISTPVTNWLARPKLVDLPES